MRFPHFFGWATTISPYFSVNPASTGKVTPVTYLASSEARNSTALEMSRDSTHGKSWDDATLADPVAAARARRRRARARIPGEVRQRARCLHRLSEFEYL
jgi:hypothetical protein